MDLLKEKEIAIGAAKEAGRYLLENFRQIKRTDFGYKDSRELVTRVDIESEKTIKKILGENFPDYDFLGEETGDKLGEADWQWVIDPLDGTTNYLMGLLHFGVSIALLYKNETVLGVIYLPVLNELCIAEKGKGAYINDKCLEVSSKENLEDAFLVHCSGMSIGQLNFNFNLLKFIVPKTSNTRQVGSAVVECSLVAGGQVEAYWGRGLKKWDIAAGVLLVREAGGHVLDFEGNEWNWESESFLATNGKIDEALLEEIKKAKEQF